METNNKCIHIKQLKKILTKTIFKIKEEPKEIKKTFIAIKKNSNSAVYDKLISKYLFKLIFFPFSLYLVSYCLILENLSLEMITVIRAKVKPTKILNVESIVFDKELKTLYSSMFSVRFLRKK